MNARWIILFAAIAGIVVLNQRKLKPLFTPVYADELAGESWGNDIDVYA